MYRPLPRTGLAPVPVVRIVNDAILGTVQVKLYEASTLDSVTE